MSAPIWLVSTQPTVTNGPHNEDTPPMPEAFDIEAEADARAAEMTRGTGRLAVVWRSEVTA